ncbi:hypothetical protein HMPREF1015_00277 [Bacillus smithii 7_3_47FAA]|uniref:Uncharacterized protein n=1 Tax=Bacillus smithii 7_3_47FAA TaxID=665952 RepID=G9QPR0_9BACI|nr:hypothetical protein HMPREF1015_00277 [Bacillus smithii 7_3_47FAA]
MRAKGPVQRIVMIHRWWVYAEKRVFLIYFEKISRSEWITSGAANFDKMRLLWKSGRGDTMKITKNILNARNGNGGPKRSKRGQMKWCKQLGSHL